MPEPRIEATRVSARIYSVLFDKATRDTYCEFLGPVLPDPPCGGRKTGLMSGQHVWEQLASQSRLAICAWEVLAPDRQVKDTCL